MWSGARKGGREQYWAKESDRCLFGKGQEEPIRRKGSMKSIGPALGAAAREVVWGEWLFVQLTSGMSPGKADWWHSPVQPGMVGEAVPVTFGKCGELSLAPSWFFFLRALGTQRLVPELRVPGSCLLFPLLPAAEGCLSGLVPRDVPICSTPSRALFLLFFLEVPRGKSCVGAKPLEPGHHGEPLIHAHLVVRWRVEPGQRGV